MCFFLPVLCFVLIRIGVQSCLHGIFAQLCSTKLQKVVGVIAQIVTLPNSDARGVLPKQMAAIEQAQTAMDLVKKLDRRYF